LEELPEMLHKTADKSETYIYHQVDDESDGNSGQQKVRVRKR